MKKTPLARIGGYLKSGFELLAFVAGVVMVAVPLIILWTALMSWTALSEVISTSKLAMVLIFLLFICIIITEVL